MNNTPSQSSETLAIKGYKKTKLGWIPEQWELERIGNVVEVSVAKDLNEKKFNKEKSHDFLYPVYSNTVDNFGLFGFYSSQEYTPPAVTVVGRGAGLGTAFERNKPFGAIGRLLVLHPKNKVDSRFLNFIINDKVRFYVESSGIPQLTGVQIKTYEIPIPNICEQKKIAEILSTWDEAIQKTETLIQKKEQLKRGLMQQLLEPKEYWINYKVKDLFNFLRSITASRKELEAPLNDENILNVHYGDIHTVFNNMIFLDVANSDKITSIIKEFKYPSNIDLAKDGDLIMVDASEDYEGVAECIELTNVKKKKVTAGLHTFLLRDKSKLTISGFRSLIFKSPVIRKKIMRLVTGSNVYGLSKTNLAKLEISIPPIEEQQKIIRVLKSAEQEIKNLTEFKSRLEIQKKGLMQQLLTGKTRVTIN